MTGRSVTYNWRTREEIAAKTVTGWMNSPGHRQNMLMAHYQREGIGVAFATDRAYVTQDFF